MAAKINNSITLFIFFFFKSISGKDVCTPSSCSPTGPQIRFPFRLRDRQPPHCGFPGFDLTCNNKNQTLLILPSSQSFIVNHISYFSQVINIDPNFCSPENIADIKLIDTPFDFSYVQSYTFFNCSSWNLPMFRVPCLGSVNYSVFAVQTFLIPRGYRFENCSVMTTISVPIRRYDDISNELTLIWSTPFCSTCESEGRSCGFKGDDGETGCFGEIGSSSHGIPRGAKYGVSLGIGVPALVCIIGLVFYVFSKASNYNHGQRQSQSQSIDLFSITVTPQPPSTTGLDGATIQSYPKTILGESCRLPKDDGTCPICLSDYEPKESVRTIPECNHYFHADCIDEWLKLNATCPVCRNSPETSSLVTPCSSVSSTSPNSSHATTQL